MLPLNYLFLGRNRYYTYILQHKDPLLDNDRVLSKYTRTVAELNKHALTETTELQKWRAVPSVRSVSSFIEMGSGIPKLMGEIYRHTESMVIS
jgi:hypothetical protein